MERRAIGRNELRVSVLAMGTMTFGAESDEATSHAMLDRFVEAGGTFIDTADVYSAGGSEEIIGRWFADRGSRDEFVVATKGRFTTDHDPGHAGASRKHLMEAVDASLARLDIDVIDLYQVHCWDPHTPIEETLDALDHMVQVGKVRYFGVSNFTGYQLASAATTARLGGGHQITSLQAQYNLLERTIELELVPTCIDEGIGLLPWSPLGGGWLSGKYARDETPRGASRLGVDPTRGVEAYDLRNTQRTWEILDVVAGIADQRGVPMSAIALAWLKDRPTVGSVILGARTLGQLDQNLIASDITLSDDERRRLDEVSAPGIPLYPHGFIERYGGERVWERLGTRTEPPPIGA